MNRPLRIGLLGPYLSKNFGDTAIQMAVINSLRRIFPGVELTGICPDPPDTERTHGIHAFPLSGKHWDNREEYLRISYSKNIEHRKNNLLRVMLKLRLIYEERVGRLVNIAACCRLMDALIISGSGQLDDFWGGPWKHPYSLMIWSLVARLYGCRVIVFGIGWDDLSTRLGKLFAFSALRLSHYRVFRDSGTVQKLASEGVRLESSVCPDPAFGLDIPLAKHVEQETAIIMVCPIDYRAWLEEKNISYANYLETLKECCVQWIRDGYIVRLASSQKYMDTPLAKEISIWMQTIVGESASLQLYDAESVSHFLQLARSADLVVASRLHSLILSAVAETPLVAISYGRKVSQMMSDLGLEEFCLELVNLRFGRLQEVVSRVLKMRQELKVGLMEMLLKYRAELNVQYRNIQEVVSGKH
jgi:polysaccharide pyruvyl transferase WcaK-like protein